MSSLWWRRCEVVARPPSLPPSLPSFPPPPHRLSLPVFHPPHSLSSSRTPPFPPSLPTYLCSSLSLSRPLLPYLIQSCIRSYGTCMTHGSMYRLSLCICQYVCFITVTEQKSGRGSAIKIMRGTDGVSSSPTATLSQPSLSVRFLSLPPLPFSLSFPPSLTHYYYRKHRVMHDRSLLKHPPTHSLGLTIARGVMKVTYVLSLSHIIRTILFS